MAIHQRIWDKIRSNQEVLKFKKYIYLIFLSIYLWYLFLSIYLWYFLSMVFILYIRSYKSMIKKIEIIFQSENTLKSGLTQ